MNSRISRVPNAMNEGGKIDRSIKKINVEYFEKQKELMESKGESYISKYQLEPRSIEEHQKDSNEENNSEFEYRHNAVNSTEETTRSSKDLELEKTISTEESQWKNYVDSEIQKITYKNIGSGSKTTYISTKTSENKNIASKNTTILKRNDKLLRLSGDKDFAIIEGELNSDIKSPVLAKILSGPLKGGRLLGEFTLDNDHVTIRFNKLSYKQNSIAINAIAIDPDKFQVGLADFVDRHLVTRYGSLFATSFLEGVFEAIKRNPVVYSTGNTNVQEASQLSRKEQMLQAAGKTGQAFTPFAKQYFNKPTTVKLNQGRGIGVLFIDKVIINNG